MKLSDLKALVSELQTQDNLATGNPIFLVQQRERIFGMDPAYGGDEYEWSYVDDPEYSFGEPEVFGQIREDCDIDKPDAEIDPEEYGYEKIYYIDRWEYVCAHFTRKAAESYIEANRHNLTEPRVYVHSQYRCHEFNAVVGVLSAISEAMELLRLISAALPENLSPASVIQKAAEAVAKMEEL